MDIGDVENVVFKEEDLQNFFPYLFQSLTPIPYKPWNVFFGGFCL